MMDNAANAIVDTPEWRAAAGLTKRPSIPSHDLQGERQYRSWVRAASKHLKILEVVRGIETNEHHQGAGQVVDPPQPPFHALHCAASQGMTGAGKLLLERFSGNAWKQQYDVVNIPDAAFGFTPLHWASVTNRLDFMILLLEEGACIDARDRAGRTPLYACAAFGAADAAALLLQRGAVVDRPDFRGLTPLHAAAAGNHIEVAEELLSAGACVRRRSSFGCSARHVAERQGHASMVEFLAEAARHQAEGGLQEETLAQVGGGDPLGWLFSTLRAAVGMHAPGMRSVA
eukprot:g19762.t1